MDAPIMVRSYTEVVINRKSKKEGVIYHPEIAGPHAPDSTIPIR